MELTQVAWLILIILPPLLHLLLTASENRKQNLPPGPPKLPLIGNLHQLVFSNGQLPHRRLTDLSKSYGPIMHLQLGHVPTVVFSSADVAKAVLKTHDAVCCSRPTLIAGKELFYNCTDIGMAPYGEYWRQLRKISTLEMFTNKRVESFRSVREEEVGDFVKAIVVVASHAAGDHVVNLSSLLFGLSFNITTRVAFSKKGKEQEAFRATVMKGTKLISGFSLPDLYPSSKLLYLLSGMRKKLKECSQEINKIFDPLIEEHMLNKKRFGNENRDMVDVLLDFHEENVQGANNFSLTIDNIKAEILEIFAAGSETSSTVLEWAMAELIKNPRVMAKAQDEVRQIYQAKGVIDESNLDELKYMKLVIKETLRLHPPVPLLVPRETIEECQIQNYDIPLKTRVIINAWAIARDPDYWKNPESFIPERFEDSVIDFKGSHFELIPFGGGRRKCPGMSLGIANIELPLANLLYHFDWKLPNNKQPNELDMDEVFGITSRRKNDLFVIPIPHS